MNICVFGAASDKLDAAYFTLAETLGQALARRGHRMIFGGGATGLMGAAARGVLAEGGSFTGVAPRFFDIPGVLMAQGEMIFTETMAERKTIMRDSADAFIALPGGIGTYEEFLETLTLKQLGRHRKPIALLETLGYFEPMDAMLRHTVQSGFMAEECLGMYRLFSDAEACLDYLER